MHFGCELIEMVDCGVVSVRNRRWNLLHSSSTSSCMAFNTRRVLPSLKEKKKNHEMSVSTSLISQNNMHDLVGTQHHHSSTKTRHPIAKDPALKRLAQNNSEAPHQREPQLARRSQPPVRRNRSSVCQNDLHDHLPNRIR
jgi:hypothetical protein